MSEHKLGFLFREMMSGGIALGETDPQRGAETGKDTVLEMHGVITIDDLDAFLADPKHLGVLDATLNWAPFGTNIPAPGGVFNLFSPSDNPKLKLMVYECGFEHGGEPYYFAGHKNVEVHPLYDVWKDTTTLYTTVHRGKDKSGPVAAAGIISLSPLELMKMSGTFRALNARSAEESAKAVAEFGRFFLGELWDTYVKKAGG